jgi:hypothetical protein
VGGEICFEKAWFDEGNTDAELSDFGGESFGVAFDGVFGGGVEAVAWNTDVTCEGGEIDDSSFVFRSEDWQNGICHSYEAEEVGFEEVFSLLEGSFFGWAVEDLACVVDEDVDSAGVGEDRSDTVFDGFIGLNIESEHAIILAGGWIWIACGSEYRVAVLREKSGDFAAKAGGCSGDKDDRIYGSWH